MRILKTLADGLSLFYRRESPRTTKNNGGNVRESDVSLVSEASWGHREEKALVYADDLTHCGDGEGWARSYRELK